MAGGQDLAVAANGGLDWDRSGPGGNKPVKRATYQDVLNAPENKVAEILDGELFLSPRPTPRHAMAQTGLLSALHVPFDRGLGGPGGWWILTEPELHLGEQVVVPDLAGWRRERMPAMPDEAFFSLAPDWVCEVLSPSTERIDRSRKLRIYAEAGVQHAWLVKPTDHTLEVFRLREGAWTIVAVWEDAAVVRAEPFEAIELGLEPLWAGAPPPSRG
jgi:Uma2 family endonuclease